jgi:putative Holliday junction resolvase
MNLVHKRILGLDIGDKRIGVAVSDPMRIIAQFVGTLTRTRTSEDFDKLLETAKEYDVSVIIAGLPRRLDGSSSPQTEKVEAFINELSERTDIPVQAWDERLTTTSAEASLIEANVRRRDRRKVIDSVAAQIMLQHYLDCNQPQDHIDPEDEQRTEYPNDD